MAAGLFTPYTKFVQGLSQAKFNLGVDTNVLILTSNSYVPLPNSHSLYSDVSGTELPTALGYTVGGVALSGITNTLSGAVVTFSCGTISFATFSATCRYGVIIRRAGGSLVAGDLLIAFCDLGNGSPVQGTGTTATITPASSGGLFTLTHAP